MVTLNFHINYNCPLACRYCAQRDQLDKYNGEFSGEEMIEKVQEFLDYHNTDICRVNISGGEPLLKFKDIQKLIEHFPKNVYAITTSGYPLTAEKAKFLSKYNVKYILSVDGGEQVTNYLRPLANGKQGYFKKLKENIPHILYYAPQTRAKIIVSKNLISEIFNSYLELERLGFQEIFITPNVYENTVNEHRPDLKTGVWQEEDWQKFREQIFLILKEIKLGIEINKKRCYIGNIIEPLAKAMVPEFGFYNPSKMICEVLTFKMGLSPANGEMPSKEKTKINSYCMVDVNPNIKNHQDLLKRVDDDYKKMTGICPKDENCPYQSLCMYSVCISENLKENKGNILTASDFQCNNQKIYLDAAFDFLESLKIKNDTTDRYWDEILSRKEAIINGSNEFLSWERYF